MTERVLGGRYRLRDRIGDGGMGTVWAAVDETLRRDVAVKEVRIPEGLAPEARRRLVERARREARAASLVDHPNVVTVHDVVVEDDRPWIVMELVGGDSLARMVEARGPWRPEHVAHLGLKLLDALEAAHARGVVHRDVKPSNVLIDRDRVVLTDFGIAGIDGDVGLTGTGEFTGSPGFTAPEVLREQPAGPASDLWALGATLYTAVEGRAPFQRDTPMATLGAVLTEEPTPPRHAGSLAPLLWHLLQKDPAERMRPDAARQVLRNVAAGLPSGLRDPVVSPPASRRCVLVTVVASAGVIAVLAGTAFALTGGEERKAVADPPRTPPPSSAPSPPSVTPTTAPKPEPLDLCALLTRDQIGRLVPGAPRTERDTDSCSWAVRGRGLTVTHRARATPDRLPESSTEAHTEFLQARREQARPGTRVWHWSEMGVPPVVRATSTAARTAPGVGAEAFAYDVVRGSKPFDKSVVTFRSGIHVLEVELAYARGTATPGDAVRAARLVAQNVEKRS
ncbi:serine/threonine-protein kinase [Actinomadura kijaniata]|uniref:serine/threonine-protein kinase n=1 Tax=Actinomadura kijaniata TaxID=46161 RepID=UPI0008328A70|nr:serine/threonine-protein kinase [Actinomadura kijaniata]